MYENKPHVHVRVYRYVMYMKCYRMVTAELPGGNDNNNYQ